MENKECCKQTVSDKYQDLLQLLVDSPPSREMALAITNLQQSSMWCGLAIAMKGVEQERAAATEAGGCCNGTQCSEPAAA